MKACARSILVLFMLLCVASFAAAQGHPKLKIIKEGLFTKCDRLTDCPNCLYFVKGTVYNTNETPVKNVRISYYIWKKFKGDASKGLILKETGGLVTASIKYIPPKSAVEFIADSDDAPVFTIESAIRPDPLNAIITAEWDKN